MSQDAEVPSQGRIKVYVVDDHSIVRHGLTSYLSVTPDIDVVGEAAEGREAVAAITAMVEKGTAPDIVLMDLVMPGLDGIGATAAINKLSGAPRVIALTSFGDPEKLRSALRAGVCGYLLKNAPAECIAAAVRAAHAGQLYLDATLSASLTRAVAPSKIQIPLTPRERDVITLVTKGNSNKNIAAALFISERTARSHVSHLLGKLGLTSRMQLAIWALDNEYPFADAWVQGGVQGALP